MIEVIFKGERKEIYDNPQQFPFKVGDHVIVEAEKGEDLGIVNQIGPMLKRKNVKGDCKNLIRKSTIKDLEKFNRNREKELQAFKKCRKKVVEHNLDMKLVDVEYQFDGNKITFYFTAEKRVDFRELVKDLASIYKVRIELRQIGVRDEAKRIGGYGLCGRKLCCTSFLTEFEPITTQCAKEQNLPLNPQKLSGLCGRLLCCLMFEREFYQDQSCKLPQINALYKTPQGTGRVVKLDVFNECVTLIIGDSKFESFSLEELDNFKKLESSDKGSKHEDAGKAKKESHKKKADDKRK